MDRHTTGGARYIIGVILIILGILIFLDTTNLFYFDVMDIVFSFPFLLTVIGLFIVLNSEKKVLGAIILILGLIFLLPEIFPWIDIDGEVIWPLLIIGLGIYIIVKHRSSGKEHQPIRGENVERDVIEDVSIFGGGTKVVNSNNFKGGSVTAIFGGSDIDLTNCKLAEGNSVIDVLALFGGSEIIVPRDWNVKVQVTAILGGFSNKVKKQPGEEIDESRTLIVKGFVMFGGGEVKTIY